MRGGRHRYGRPWRCERDVMSAGGCTALLLGLLPTGYKYY